MPKPYYYVDIMQYTRYCFAYMLLSYIILLLEHSHMCTSPDSQINSREEGGERFIQEGVVYPVVGP